VAQAVALLDISRRRVRLLRGARGLPVAEHEIRLAEGLDSLPDALDDFERSGLLAAARWLVTLSGDLYSVHRFTVPLTDPKKVRQTLEFELENELPFRADEVVVSSDIRRVEGGCEVVAAAARADLISGLLEALKGRGVDVAQIAPSSFGLVDDAARADGRHLVVDVGAQATDILALEDGRFVASFRIDAGGDAVNSALAKSHFLATEEAERAKREGASDPRAQEALTPAVKGLARQIARGLRGSLRNLGWKDPLVIVAGGGAGLSGLPESLERDLGLKVELRSDEAGPLRPERGAIEQLLSGRPFLPINLRAGHLAYQGDMLKALRQLSGVAPWAAAILLLLSAQLFVDVGVLNSRAGRYDAARQAACAKLAGLTGGNAMQCLARMKERIAGTGTGDIPRFDAVEVLVGLSGGIPAALEVQLDEIRIDGKSMRLVGSTTGFHQASQLAAALAKVPCVKALRKEKTAKQGARVKFTFTGAIDCSDAPVIGGEGAGGLSALMGGANAKAVVSPSGPSQPVPVESAEPEPPPEGEHPDDVDPMGQRAGSGALIQAPGFPQVNPKIILPKGVGAMIKVPNLGRIQPMTTFGDRPGALVDPTGAMYDPEEMVDPNTGMPSPPPSPEPEEEE
jgi:hypothetical protein